MKKAPSFDLPEPLTLRRTLGPSFILLGLALGSGELILWPYLAANYGLGLLWGGLLGITFQFILNTEVMRYALYWGESVFVGFKKILRYAPIWFIVSTFIPWALPGFSSASSQIIASILGLSNPTPLAIFILLITGLVLSAGKFLYKTMEILQKSAILIGLPLIIFLVARLSNPTDWQELASGLIGQGNGWWFFPPGIALGSFLGAFAYSGAGGNLNLAQSYYVKEKGLGMGKYTSKITSLFSPGEKLVSLDGQTFEDNRINRSRWNKWWVLINKEHALVFWALGFVTIILLAVLAKTLTSGLNSESGISFIYQEASVISAELGAFIGTLFLAVAALMLLSTQIGVLESSSRIISENFLLLKYKPGMKSNPSLAFYIALWSQIIFGIFTLLSGFKEPRLLLTLSAILNAAAMMVSFALIYFLNRSRLASSYHPHPTRVFIIAVAFSFFVYFLLLTIMDFRI